MHLDPIPLQERKQQVNSMIRRCFDDYCFYNQMPMDERKSFVEYNMMQLSSEDVVIPFLSVYVTTHCTLNCEKCINLMPYFKGKAMHFSLEKTIQSLDLILPVVKEITFVEIVGGEPFLYPQLLELLDYLSNQSKVRQIKVVTNATVIPEETILNKLKVSNALVNVSDYGLFEKMSHFVSILDRAGVNVRVVSSQEWMDSGDLSCRGRQEEALRVQYKRCMEGLKSKYLCEDMLFTCTRAVNLHLLGIFSDKRDQLSISQGLTSDMIRSFYLREEGAVCDYCDLYTTDGTPTLYPAGEQAGRKLERSHFTVISNYELNKLRDNSRAYLALKSIEENKD